MTLVLALLVASCSSDGGPTTGADGTAPPSGGAEVERNGATAAGSPAPTIPLPPDASRTLAFSGDLLTHLPLVAAARRGATGDDYDFEPMLAPLAPVVEGADLALCHLEVPLVGDGQEITGYPAFHAPRQLAAGVAAAGYDGCSTASNHSLDGGLPGIEATLDTFDLLGLGHAGTARSAAEAATPRLYDVGGVAVAHLSYAYGFNGYELPDGAPWAANAIDPARIGDDARAARALGAQLVVVSVHWGTEYSSEPDAFQIDTATMLDGISDIDLVIGHHAHVVQPIEQVGDTWVVYGLGNQLSNQSEPPRRDGLTIVVTVGGRLGGRWSVRRIEAVPTWVDLATYEVLPVVPTLDRPDLDPGLRSELEASLVRTMTTVNRRDAAVGAQGS